MRTGAVTPRTQTWQTGARAVAAPPCCKWTAEAAERRPAPYPTGGGEGGSPSLAQKTKHWEMGKKQAIHRVREEAQSPL